MQIKPLAAPLAAAASTPGASAMSNREASFARHLQERRSESAPASEPPPKPVAHAPPDERARRSHDAPRSDRAQHGGARPAAARSEGKTRPPETRRAAAPAAEPQADAPSDARAGKAASHVKAAAQQAPDAALEREAGAVDPVAAAPADAALPVPAAALAEWLARLAPPESPGTGRATAGTLGDEPTTAAQPLQAPGRSIGDTPGADPKAATTRLGAEPNDRRGAADATPSATVVCAELHAEASAAIGSAVRAVQADARPGAEAAPGNALATLGALGVAAPHAAPPAAAATPTSVSIAAPLGTPAFAPALAASVSLLARDGVQEARLQLHPAELGPIAVQIALDGAQARVDFTAEVAATRHAIEAGLPELASALREAGLTLAGGGVFQQARDAQEGAPQPGTHHGGGSRRQANEAHEDGLPARGDAPRRVVVGGVDEYA